MAGVLLEVVLEVVEAAGRVGQRFLVQELGVQEQERGQVVVLMRMQQRANQREVIYLQFSHIVQ